MLTYQDIIDKLTIEQKLSLLADISSLGFTETDADVRFIAETSMEKINAADTAKTVYPPFANLANSWSPDLIGRVADRLSERAKRSGYTLLNIPTANVKVTPHAAGFTEDAFLSGTISGACAAAGTRVGIKTCIADPTMSQEDVEHSDMQADMRAVRGHFLKPFDIVLKHGVSAMQTTAESLKGSYENVNDESVMRLQEKTPMIYRCQTADDVLKYVKERGNFCKNGSVAVLKAAFERYNTLQKAFEAGEVSLSEIETECKEGNALSLEMIDSALDSVLEFTLACEKLHAKTIPQVKDTEENLSLTAAAESVVLLKNEKVLPLHKKTKVAIVGGLAEYTDDPREESVYKRLLELSKNKKLNCIGYAKGYNAQTDRSDDLIRAACDLARKAEVVVAVLGFHKQGAERARRNKNSKLPANQLALIQALSRLGKKIVAVVVGEVYPDMKFDKVCDGVLLAPLGGTKSGSAVCEVLTGKINPSGKLAFTCYNNTDEHFAELRAYKDAGRNKVGTFYGYRHYDISDLRVKYPFGHGLSYTKFKYSNLRVTASGITFTIRNVGMRAGSEVVQIYIGKKDSSIVRPLKELKAFTKVHILPGHSKRVTISFKQLDLGVWEKNKFTTERGLYEIYVGSSCKDIRLTGRFHSGGEVFHKDKARYSDYLQARSNIHAGSYYLDVPTRIPPDKNEKRQKAWIVATVAVFCLDIAFAYLNYVRWMPKLWWIYVIFGVANALPIALSIVYTRKKRKVLNKHLENNMNEKKKKREQLNVEDLADEIPFEELFEEEFAPVRAIEREETVVEEKEEKIFASLPFDKEFTASQVSEQLASFLYERGVAIELQTARTLLSAFASSRLLIFRSEEKDLLSKLLALLGEYFGDESAIDVCSGEDDGATDILYKNGETSAIAQKIMRAALSDNLVHIAAIVDAKADALRTALAPIIRFVDQPDREAQILVRSSLTQTDTYELAENLWFIVALAEGEKVTDIPKYILDMACIVDLQLKRGHEPTTRLVVENGETAEETTATEETEKPAGETPETEEKPKKKAKNVAEVKVVETVVEREKTPIKQVCYSQLLGMIKDAFRDYQIDEILWKRVDKLEEYANVSSEYRIENKLWQRMEKYASVFLAAGGVEEEALDGVVAHHLTMGILVALKEAKKPLEEKFAHTLENIFGEGHVPKSLKAVKTEGLDL